MANRTPLADLDFDARPDSAFVDIRVVAALYGRSVSSIRRDVLAGRIPAPVRVGPMAPRWNVGTLRRHVASLNDQA